MPPQPRRSTRWAVCPGTEPTPRPVWEGVPDLARVRRDGPSATRTATLAIVEAMKMETEVRAMHSGTVAEVLVSEGDAVTTSDAIIAMV